MSCSRASQYLTFGFLSRKISSGILDCLSRTLAAIGWLDNTSHIVDSSEMAVAIWSGIFPLMSVTSSSWVLKRTANSNNDGGHIWMLMQAWVISGRCESFWVTGLPRYSVRIKSVAFCQKSILSSREYAEGISSRFPEQLALQSLGWYVVGTRWRFLKLRKYNRLWWNSLKFFKNPQFPAMCQNIIPKSLTNQRNLRQITNNQHNRRQSNKKSKKSTPNH